MQLQLRPAESRNQGFPDDSGGPAYVLNRRLEERRSESAQMGLGMDRDLGATGTLELRAARFQRDTLQDTPSVAPGVRDPFGLPAIVADGNYRRNELQVGWRLPPLASWEVLLGAGHQTETGRLASSIFLSEPVAASFAIRRITNNLVAETRKAFGTWSMQAGVRYERSPQQDSMLPPALSLQYQLAEDSGRVGMALSSARKLPSFYALGHPFVGNPELKPERGRQAELYYTNGDSSPWKWRVTLFRAHYRDLVDFEAGPPPRLEPGIDL